ncbi:MAG: acyl--CoA ligase [Deltaproteobacteria bacterium]|nr:acyl--CoA ligase [Deltaproteobacteria bacterium]MDL1961154.1 acyl--CoA ligase [Deltaproteobacteria bacterium]
MTLIDLFKSAVNRFPDNVAVKDRRHSLTYKELQSLADGLTAFLIGAGFAHGDRVGLLVDSSVQYVVAYLGILQAGCIAIPLNTDNSRRNLDFVLQQCGVKCLIGQSRYLSRYQLWSMDISIICSDWSDALKKGDKGPGRGVIRWEQAIEKIPDVDAFPDLSNADLACILFTSGTTGEPKGVMLSHGNLVANTRSIVSYLHLKETDSILAVLPFFYSYGSSLLHTHLAVGGTVHIEGQFVYPNKALERMANERITGFAGVPSTFALLLHRSNFNNMRWPYLRYVTQAGGAMAPSLAKRLGDVLLDADIYIMYGQTEATARLSYLPPDRFVDKLDSIGKAIPGVELRVVDEKGHQVSPGQIGEIIARGENIMQGYWGQPEETAKVLRNGWLYTGDLARVDEEGLIYIESRKSDIIKSGAHRISPKEIEEVMAAWPGVHEVAVTGCPDPILGEAIWAFVVPEGNQILEHKAIIRHCHNNLASFKVPHELVELTELPKTTSGKIKKTFLRNEYAIS